MGRPTLPTAERLRNHYWAQNLLFLAQEAVSQGRTPPKPYKAKAYRANVLWLERFMRANADGNPLPSAERPQALAKVFRRGADPTKCYQRTPAADEKLRQGKSKLNQPELLRRRGPEKGVPYSRESINLVELGERLLPGSRDAFDADFWALLGDKPRDLADTHAAVEDHLDRLGLFRPIYADILRIGELRLASPWPQQSHFERYAYGLSRLTDASTPFDIHIFSLLANLLHESYLMGNPELHTAHLLAFKAYFTRFMARPLSMNFRHFFRMNVQRRVVQEDRWPAYSPIAHYPVTTSQPLLMNAEWVDLTRDQQEQFGSTQWFDMPLPH